MPLTSSAGAPGTESTDMLAEKQQMRLLQIIPTPGRGGCEEYALTVAREAVRRGWEVVSSFPDAPATKSLVLDYRSAGVRTDLSAIGPCCDRPPHHFRTVSARFWRTRRVIRRVRPDVVQVVLPMPYYGLGSLLAAATQKVPTQVVFQLVTPDSIPLGRRATKLYDWARRQQQSWTAVSEQNRQLLGKLFHMDPESIQLVYNGAEYRIGAEGGNQRAAFLSARGWSSDTVMVLGVGRLDCQKGFDLLIQAIPHVVKSFPNARFAIAGEGGARAALERLVQERGVEKHIALLGHRTDVPELMAASDVFAFPSRYEGHPFALLEAMSAKLPVIASSASGIPEIVADRQNGVLFRANDSCDLLENLRWLLGNRDRWPELAAMGHQSAMRFTKTKMLEETFALLATRDVRASTLK